MGSLSQPGSIPHALKHAHQRLIRRLDDALREYERPKSSFSSGTEVCRAVEPFVDELCRLPGGKDELQRRSCLIETKCREGSDYDQAKQKALRSYGGRPWKPSRSMVAIKGLRTGNKNPNPRLLADVIRERDHLETILNKRILGLSADAITAFEEWLQQSQEIGQEADPLEVDGCYHLYHVHQAVQRGTSKVSQLHRAMIERSGLGGTVLASMKAATESLYHWVRGEIQKLGEKREQEPIGADDGDAASGDRAPQPSIPTQEAEQQRQQPTDQDGISQDAIWSVRDLAKEYDLNPEALRKRLQRWRRHNDEGWVELLSSERRRNEPQFLYRLRHIQPVISDMLAKKASG